MWGWVEVVWWVVVVSEGGWRCCGEWWWWVRVNAILKCPITRWASLSHVPTTVPTTVSTTVPTRHTVTPAVWHVPLPFRPLPSPPSTLAVLMQHYGLIVFVKLLQNVIYSPDINGIRFRNSCRYSFERLPNGFSGYAIFSSEQLISNKFHLP